MRDILVNLEIMGASPPESCVQLASLVAGLPYVGSFRHSAELGRHRVFSIQVEEMPATEAQQLIGAIAGVPGVRGAL